MAERLKCSLDNSSLRRSARCLRWPKISIRTRVRHQRTRISHYVQPRTMNNTSNIGMGMPNAQSRAQPIAPVSFSMIFDKIFIIPPKKVASPPFEPADPQQARSKRGVLPAWEHLFLRYTRCRARRPVQIYPLRALLHRYFPSARKSACFPV
jgi:hypothetical protein